LRLPALLGVVLAASVAALLLSGGAMADATFTANDVSVTSNGGNLQSLTAAPSGHIHYDGLEQAPSSVEIVVDVKRSGASSWETVDSKSISATGQAGNVSFDFTTIDLLAASSLKRSDFKSSDGSTASTDVDIRVTATLVGAGPDGDDVTTDAQQTFTVAVENIPAGGSIGGAANTGGS
jgi:hypothetical protein